MILPSGEEITCSFGYIDESCGVWPRFAKMLAKHRAASGTSGSAQDAQRLDQKGAGPVAKPDAQPSSHKDSNP